MLFSFQEIVQDFPARRMRWKPPSFLMLFFLAVALSIFAITYQALYALFGVAPAPASFFLYRLFTLLQLAVLYYLLERYYAGKRLGPIRIFWASFLQGIFLIGFLYVLSWEHAPGLDPLTYQPADVLSAIQIGIVALLVSIYGLSVFFRFRILVFFKRTRVTLRNWYVMVGFMGLASLSMFWAQPKDSLNAAAIIFSIAAVSMMIVNAFRLSWIVYLSFREKLIAILVTTAYFFLVLMLLIGMPGQPDWFEWLEAYSYPVSLFIQHCLVFSGIYATTSLLSLLFHLPTTGDFQKKIDELAALHSLSRLVSQVFNFRQLVSTIVHTPVEAGLAEVAWLVLLEDTSRRPQVVAARGVVPDEIAKKVDIEALFKEAQTSKAGYLLIPDVSNDPRVSDTFNDSLHSLLVIPLVARDEPLGALFLARDVTYGFEEDDIEALRAFADQAALALDNARLFQELLEKERLEKELAIAREVQQKLLPQTLPQVPGAELVASSVPATEVGGDYYDAREVHEDQIACIVADVAGKGTSAAFYMAEMQGVFHALAPICPSPKTFICQANDALARSLEKNVFISVAYGLLDASAARLHLARAGHCPPVWVRLTGEAQYVKSSGLAIGLDRTPRYCKWLEEQMLELLPGDVVVLYTDGLVESRNIRGEEYGYDRLLQLVKAYRYEEAQRIHEIILTDLRQFLEGQPYTDDLTLMVLKWHGFTEESGREEQKTVSLPSEN